jgi:hypothetical protein
VASSDRLKRPPAHVTAVHVEGTAGIAGGEVGLVDDGQPGGRPASGAVKGLLGWGEGGGVAVTKC